MNLVKKAVVWLIAAVAVALFVFGFLGVKTYYGDISTTVINGVGDMTLGNGMAGTISVKMIASGADVVPSAEDLKECKRVIDQRLAGFNLPDAHVYINYDSPSLIIEMPLVSDLNSIISIIGSKGELIVRRGTEETVSSVIFNIKNVESGNVRIDDSNSLFSLTHVSLEVDSAAKAALSETTSEMAQEYAATEEAQKLSLWYDGVLLTSIDVTEPIKNGKLTFDRIFNLNPTQAYELSVLLNSDDIPYDMVTAGLYESDAMLTSAPKAIIIAGGAAAVVIALYFLFRYRAAGLSAVFALVGTAGSLIAVQTGFFSTNLARTFSFASLTAFVLVVLFAAYILLHELSNIRLKCNENAVRRSVLESQKETLSISLRALASVFAVSVVLSLFARQRPLFKALVSVFTENGISTNVMVAVGEFGKTMAWGMLFTAIFCVFCNRWMIASLLEYKFANKASMFGGNAKHEDAANFKGKKLVLAVLAIVAVAGIVGTLVLGLGTDEQFHGAKQYTAMILVSDFDPEAVDLNAIEKDLRAELNADVDVTIGLNYTNSVYELCVEMTPSTYALLIDDAIEMLNEKYPDLGITEFSERTVAAADDEAIHMTVLFAVLALAAAISFALAVLFVRFANALSILAASVLGALVTFSVYLFAGLNNFSVVVCAVIGSVLAVLLGGIVRYCGMDRVYNEQKNKNDIAVQAAVNETSLFENKIGVFVLGAAVAASFVAASIILGVEGMLVIGVMSAIVMLMSIICVNYLLPYMWHEKSSK